MSVTDRPIETRGEGVATTEGAGVRLVRLIGHPRLPDLDPFLLFDAFDSTDPDTYIAGFPNHPHRGFETVTYMLEGRMLHEDSLGNKGELGPGDLQWMTAGRGIIHSEMPVQEQGSLRGFQLWVNLPKSHKMMPPRYQDIPSAKIPVVTTGGGHAKVLAGNLEGVRGPVEGGHARPTLLDVTLPPSTSTRIELPTDAHGFAYVIDGAGQVGNPAQGVHKGQLATFGEGGPLPIRAHEASLRLLVACAKPLDEPVVRYGPFVMNSREEIEQAFADYRAGRLDRP